MHGLFISYRRDDASAYARLLYERLAQEFGKNQIFMDVESIREPGTDFVEAIEKGVGQCGVLLALIGDTWVNSTDRQGQRRLDNPEDFVRIEIAAALARDVRVMPILVQAAKMPRPDELPENLRILTRRQALTLSHEDWEHDVGKLIAALDRIDGFERRKPEPAWRPPPAQPEAPPSPPPAPRRSKTPLLAAAAVGAVAVIAAALLIPDQTDPPGPIYDPVDVFEPRPAPKEGLDQANTGNTGQVAQTYDIPARKAAPSQQNLSGIWYDDNGMPVQIVDNGGQLQISAMNFLTEQFMPIGTGRFDGSDVNIRYNNAGVSGTVTATLAPDGRHLNGQDTTDALRIPVQNSWHFNHMPGQ